MTRFLTATEQTIIANAMDPIEREISRLETAAAMLEGRQARNLRESRDNDRKAAECRHEAAILRDRAATDALIEFANREIVL
jgi:hypothetical protein